MTRRKNPWQLLGIKRTATEREVKSAYARKLKVTRPEADADAFQRLVEARDIALSYARSQPEPATAEEIFTSDEIESDAPRRIAGVPDEEEKISFQSQPSPDEQAAHDIARSDQDGDESQRVVDTISRWISGQSTIDSFDEVDRQVRLVSGMSFVEREHAEREFLFNLRDRLVSDEVVPLESSTKHLVQSLNEEFGWTENDRHIVNMLDFGADIVSDRLQFLQNPQSRPVPSEKPNYWRLLWVAFIILWVLSHFARRG